MIKSILKYCWYRLIHLFRLPAYIINKNNINLTSNVAIGISLKHCKIGKYNYLARGGSYFNVEVGNYCCLGPDIHIGGMQHSYWWYSMSPILSDECKFPDRTIIGNDVWIGAQAIIKQGVKIGDGAVIGANSFVNKDVAPFSIVVGSPAKHIKFRFDEKTKDIIIKSEYWNYPPEVAKEIIDSIQCL